ncbi:hypothetical protein FSC37_04360 [Piscinibacter aquaticus]|uniref:L-seryl-tRNA selenium transferase N-terminal domain-containing protein n=1 Tax=Piscinibacter aquaticus TaxID=392597 RepID=A0A5C6U0Y1_9BURK|nr:hypothetical protein FSC37_04360 [Piscinibacter aquaticus]
MTATAHRPPALDKLLDSELMQALALQHGRVPLRDAARAELERWRSQSPQPPFDVSVFEAACSARPPRRRNRPCARCST